MKNVIFNLIIVVCILVGSIFIAPMKASTAMTNLKDYTKSIQEIKQVSKDIDGMKDKVSASRKQLQELRGNSAVDLEDADAIYKAVTSIDGVIEKSALLLRIDDGTTSVRAEYDENNKEVTSRADGIQITVKVKDVFLYIHNFEALKLPVESLNVVYPENKVIMTLNTKGGQI